MSIRRALALLVLLTACGPGVTPAPDAPPPLVAARQDEQLADAAPRVREETIRNLRDSGRADLIAPFLQDTDPRVRCAAADALGRLKAKEQAGAVARLIGDNRHDVRVSAVLALAAMDAREQADAVASLLKDAGPVLSGQAELRAAAVETLGRLRAVQHAPAVATFLRQDEGEGVRLVAVIALGQMGARDQAVAIAPLLKDEKRWIRAFSAKALGRLQAREHAEAIRSLLDDPEPEVREAAGVALKDMSE
jgi:HEAT repeat protein